MRTKPLFLALLYIFVSGKATAFLSFKEQQRIHKLQSRRDTNAHLCMMDITVVHYTFDDLNPDSTAEMISDASSVALDLAGVVTPSRLHVLSFAILGRLLVLYRDFFLDGHSVPPEEVAVQAFLLMTNIKELIKTISENRSTME